MDIGMPIRETEGLVEGQKFVYVAYEAKGLELRSGVLKRSISVVGVSRCLDGPHTTPAPSLACRCGFYMWSGTDGEIPWGGNLRLARAVVRGTGKIIEHEQGHRTQFQRILSLEFMPWCSCCGQPADRLRPSSWPINCGLDTSTAFLTPVCGACEVHGGPEPFSLAEVGRRLRVPVKMSETKKSNPMEPPMWRG